MNSSLFDKEGSKEQRNLLSYAYLAQASKVEGDLIGGITSIFKPIAKIRSGEIFNSEEFCALVDDLYGLKIHPWAVEDLIPRLEHNGLVVRNRADENIEEVLYAEITEEFTDITEKDIGFLSTQFVDFCKPILEKHGLPFNETELSDGFLEHLTNLNFISVTLNPDAPDKSNESKKTLTLEWEEKN